MSLKQLVRAVEEFKMSLRKRDIEIIFISIDRIHFHVLARFGDRNARKWIGIAKK